jgi:outer membrane protein OmpA-like peptidoglycan-associated protein
MPKDNTNEQVESEQHIEQVRTLILGKNNSLISESIKKEARTLVTDVVTEALHDRQKQDSSVNKVLQPLIEDSVKHSVTHNSERLISSLYPLVGSLVRKSVAAFLSDFMEKTNQLLENSLTLKGLKWRLKAWQTNVSFAQYAASQTFAYRVEHVFLIHRETGLLLNSVDLDNEGKSDADMVSSMLSAINSFVGDSFLTGEEGQKEQLQTVSTDSFNLLIKPGPSALVVAAVIGNPPQKISDQLQLTLENIHQLYFSELNLFDGDNQPFVNAENLLLDCLLSEQKTVENKNKKPWLALALLFLTVVFLSYQGFSWMKSQQLHEKIMQLDHEPGIVIRQLTINSLDDISLDILRDPNAVKLSLWLKNKNLAVDTFTIIERNYHSLDAQILFFRAEKIISQFPQVNLSWQNNILSLSGKLGFNDSEQLLSSLAIAGFTKGQNLDIGQLQLISTQTIASSRQVKQQIFDDLIGRVSSTQLDFAVASEAITVKMQASLEQIKQYMEQLNALANELNINIGLLIIGCSDNTGNIVANNALSLNRANNTEKVLINKGLNADQMYVVGLGQIDINTVKNTARKVIFNVIYINEAHINDSQLSP